MWACYRRSLEMGGKESRVGPGQFAGETGKEIVHHHYKTVPSGEMREESDSDDEGEGKKDSK